MTKGSSYRANRLGGASGTNGESAYERFLQKLASKHPHLVKKGAKELNAEGPPLRLRPRKKRAPS
jgi:hypothetical protein